MNQSELIDKVAQATALNQAAAGQTVKAVVNAILDSLVAGEAVRVSGLGTFDVRHGPPARGGIHARARIATRLAGPHWRLPEARRPGIIAGASLARRTVNLPISVVKITVVGPEPVCGSRLRAVWKMLRLSPEPKGRIRFPSAASLVQTGLPPICRARSPGSTRVPGPRPTRARSWRRAGAAGPDRRFWRISSSHGMGGFKHQTDRRFAQPHPGARACQTACCSIRIRSCRC
jgi:nucleoid DNA-binding protein